MKAAGISLYLFNLIPLPRLDGYHLLDSLLDIALEDRRQPVDIEFGGPRDDRTYEMRRRSYEMKRFVQRGFALGSSTLCGLCILLGSWRAVW